VRGFFDARRLPEVKLADYSDRFQGPMRPVLAWVVVDPRAEVVEHGPDFAARAAGGRDRCPLYVFVDAATGRGYGAIQTCQPPYRG
jgi:hypothetical protein